MAIPVIIHLFNFKKYTRIFFPDISFLKEVKEKTKKQSQLKHILVLICRLLAFTFLVFAFAQPFTGSLQSASPNRIVSIYIDNSFSMQALGRNGELLAIARSKATDLITSSSQSTRFQILTNEFSPISQRLFNKDEALNQVKFISPSPVIRKTSEVIARQEELMKTASADNIRLIHISDFQKNGVDYQVKKVEYPLTLIPLKPLDNSNISIDSVWFNNPLHAKNGQEEFYFRIKNHDVKSPAAITLQLSLNNRQKAVATITVPAGLYVDSSFSYTNTETGLIHGQLSLNDRQVTFDDKLYFTYKVEPFIQVTSINDFNNVNDSSNYDIRTIFTNDSYYHFISYGKQNIDYSKLKLKQFIVLNKLNQLSSGLIQELEKFVASGGNVCVIPSIKPDFNSYNEFATALNLPSFTGTDTNRTLAEKPDFDLDFYKGIFERKPVQMDLPQISTYFTTSVSTRSLTTTLMRLKNGSDLITSTVYKKGKVFMFNTSTDPKAGNLGQHALFVPILLRMAEMSLTSNQPYYVFGKDPGFEIKPLAISGDNVFSLLNKAAKENFIPEFQNDGSQIRIFFNDNIKTAGNYDLDLNNSTVSGISINYTRLESELNYAEANDLEDALKQSGSTNYKVYDKPVDESKLEINAVDNTKKYWTTCVWLVLLFLFSETLILKFWKS